MTPDLVYREKELDGYRMARSDHTLVHGTRVPYTCGYVVRIEDDKKICCSRLPQHIPVELCSSLERGSTTNEVVLKQPVNSLM